MEIETKIKIDNLDETRKKLIEMGAEFKNPVTQIDDYFKPRGTEMETQRPGDFILRIRNQGELNYFTMKALTETRGAWIEHETGIDNLDEMRKILHFSGFSKVFTIEKERYIGKLNEFEICLDKVKDLGNFVEFEIMGKDAKQGKEKINNILNKLGVSEEQIEHRGYAEIISQNMGVKFEGM